MNKNKWFLNGGRGSGRSFRLLWEEYENKMAELKKACDETQELLDKQIEATYRLDKENAELKENLKHRNCLDCSNHSSKLRMRTLELEKENAELKKWKEDTIKARGNDYMAWSRQNDQLTKAKELLKRLLITSCNSDVLNLLPNCSEVLRIRAEAEQFLNSEVEK